MRITPLPGRAYQGIRGFEEHLERELGSWEETWGSLYYTGMDPSNAFWFSNCWLEPFRLDFETISEAAGALRAIQRNWSPLPFTQYRRAALIAEKLPPLPVKPKPFPWRLPEQPMGSWTLAERGVMIASARCSSPFPGGAIEFNEDKEGPPSRAYLKLWEALVLHGGAPGPGDRCLDAGASPGGWTWALTGLGAEVIAVDRAPLEARIQAMPGVTYLRHDAFTLNPRDIGLLDWLFCDVICYPPRLYAWIEKWLESGLCGNYICTIKFQGGGDEGDGLAVAKRLAEVPGSRVVHLHHNKHELTWMYSRDR